MAGGKRKQAQDGPGPAVDPFEAQQKAKDEANKQESDPGTGGRLAMFIIGFACLRFATNAVQMMHEQLLHTHIRSTFADQPLVQKTEEFFAPDLFKKIQDCFESHPLITDNILSEGAFSHTRGFLVKFSEKGIESFKAEEQLACMIDFFNSARLPEANAWVMNLLICDNKEYKPDEYAVGIHLDNTIGIISPVFHIAHQVNVLYISVPDNMEGGTLEIFPYEAGVNGTFPPDQQRTEPEHLMQPAENTMIAFKGDAWHQVKGYRAAAGQRRISLVLEQYQVTDTWKPMLTTFEVKLKNNEGMM